MRYLGNRNSGEFHDLSRRTPQCQIDEIVGHDHDRAFTPDSAGQALSEGFDPCGWCIGTRAGPLSSELLLMRVRAERAESQLAAMTVARDVVRTIIDARDRELARMRTVLAAQQQQIAAQSERLRAAETASRQLTLKAMVRSLRQAIQAGDEALTDRTVVSARAEIKASLQPSAGSAALVLTTPGTFDPGGLSTVSFELKQLPPDAAAQARHAALADIVLAVEALQRALDAQAEPDAAATAAAAAAAVSPASAEALAAVADALRPLARRHSQLKDAVLAFGQSLEALAAKPEAAEARAVAAALGQVASDLERASS